MNGEWNLDRFVEAQDDRGTYERALSEIRAGRKVSHWMWFVFPQLGGLGQSSTAKVLRHQRAGRGSGLRRQPSVRSPLWPR